MVNPVTNKFLLQLIAILQGSLYHARVHLLSVCRLWKCKRKSSLRQFLIAIAVVGATTCLISLLWHYWLKKTDNKVLLDSKNAKNVSKAETKEAVIVKPMKHIPLDEIYPDKIAENVDSFELVDKPVHMIDTTGCRIPVAMVQYNTTKEKLSCGQRAVFFKKVGGIKIKATVKIRVMKKYLRKNGTFHCCYKFFTNPIKLKDGKSTYTKCKLLNESVPILLRSEFVAVNCFQYIKNTTFVIYKDAYAFVKKIASPKNNVNHCKQKYNVLVIGMNSMSLSRFEQTMSRTVKFMKDNYWLGYRAFNKIEGEAFPNLIATLTGLDMTDLSQKCGKNMTKCNKHFIWSKFKEVGYVTAYGEDYISLPEMFSNGYEFDVKPTDHYPRALFMNEEFMVNHSLVCTGKQRSAQQMLNYALDFAVTYRRESFFGFFWIHSFSHNVKTHMADADKKIENFFNQLSYTGILRNTFVILMSAHGVLVGDSRLDPSSFYDDRMPMLFVLPATKFKGLQFGLYRSIVINQGRLVTPFDLYKTFITIKQVSLCINSTIVSESCPKCQSITQTISTNRTCKDVRIHEKWCSCRKLYFIDTNNGYGVKSIIHVVSHMQSMMKSIKTQKCWTCSKLALKTIIRMHFYYDHTHLFYVVAFSMIPGDIVYEATVSEIGGKFEVIGPISLLSDITIGNCTMVLYTRPYCFCAKVPNC